MMDMVDRPELRRINVFCDYKSPFAVGRREANETAFQAAVRVSLHLGGLVLTRPAQRSTVPADMNPIRPDQVRFGDGDHTMFFTRREVMSPKANAPFGRVDLRTGVVSTTREMVRLPGLDITATAGIGRATRAIARGFGLTACSSLTAHNAGLTTSRNECVMAGDLMVVGRVEDTFCDPCAEILAAGGAAVIAAQRQPR